MKHCRTCERDLPVSAFSVRRASRDGLSAKCRECTRAYKLRYQEQYPDRIRHQNRKKYLATHEQIKERARRWREANREHKAALDAAWQRNNPEKVKARNDRWNATHPKSRLERSQRRHARKKAAAGNATAQQIQARVDFYGGRCWMCGAPATQIDHVKPLAAGGSHWPSNLRPACGPCNRRKASMWRGVRTGRYLAHAHA